MHTKLILYTALLYILDILLWGSLTGLTLLIITFISNVTEGLERSLTAAYFSGIFAYLIIDSLLAKATEHYNDAKEFLRIIRTK